MSFPYDASGDLINAKNERSGDDTHYTAGISWASSMFPSAPRDPRIYGHPDPLDVMPPAGPFDDEDSDEIWRKTHHSTHVYTGEETIKTNRPPTTEQKVSRNQFWAEFEARRGQSGVTSAQGHSPYRRTDGEQQRFPDVLPVSSGPVSMPGVTWELFESQTAILSPISPVAQSIRHSSSSVDGEYELDDDEPSDPHQDASTSTVPDDRGQVPDSTPPKTSSPTSTDDWDDDSLLSLWRCKIIRKKGYEPMLAVFEGQTVESLHEAWKKHKHRCQQLGAAWEAAKRPKGPLSEWFVE